MNEELEQLIQELKSTLPWFLAAGIIVAGYYGVRKYVADRRTAASEIVSAAYTTDELEAAVAKFGSSKSGGILRLRLAKSYFDAGSYESALDIYNELGEYGITPVVVDPQADQDGGHQRERHEPICDATEDFHCYKYTENTARLAKKSRHSGIQRGNDGF